ncbi:MAG: PD-(D/E)XK nuclease family protein, partial [Chloroflexi bacterium]|nr:PD-(D/E)XK nuclease family protein [Chloroflexota bacterium]
EERRLFYVAMTRARDELILTHASDYGGARARRVSPFVLEALDLPTSAVAARSAAPSLDPRARLATFATAEPAPIGPARTEPIEGPLTLSHSSLDAYLTCPRKFQYSHVLRVPTAPHHSIVYGAALHHAVQEFHRAEARGGVMPQAELEAAFERAWTNEGFVSREHEQARLAAGRESLRRFRDGQLAAGAVVPAWVERDFAFSLNGDRIRGRFDRVDIVATNGASVPDPRVALAAASSGAADVIEPTMDLMGREEVTITDYKSSDVRDPAKARQRARDSLQLQIYAMAYEAMTGRLPDALQLHFLDSGLIGRVPVEPERLLKARDRIRGAAVGIRTRDYEARPDTMACTYCPYREICPSSAAR